MDKPSEDSLSSSTTRTSSTEALPIWHPQRSVQVFVSDVEEGTFGAPQTPSHALTTFSIEEELGAPQPSSQALDAFSSEEELDENIYVNDFQEAFVRMLIYFILDPVKREEIFDCFSERQAECKKLNDYVSANSGPLTYACTYLLRSSKDLVNQVKECISKLTTLKRKVLGEPDAYMSFKDQITLIELLEALEMQLQTKPDQVENTIKRLRDIERIITTQRHAHISDQFSSDGCLVHISDRLDKVFELLPWTCNPASLKEACLRQFMSGSEMQEFTIMLWDLAVCKLDQVMGAARLFCCSKEGDHSKKCQKKWGKVEPLKLVLSQYAERLGGRQRSLR